MRRWLLILLASLLWITPASALSLAPEAIYATNCEVGTLLHLGGNPRFAMDCIGAGGQFLVAVTALVDGPFPPGKVVSVDYMLRENGQVVQTGTLGTQIDLEGASALGLMFLYNVSDHMHWGELVQFSASFSLGANDPTYDFQLFEPTAEPATLLLLGSTMLVLGLRLRKGLR